MNSSFLPDRSLAWCKSTPGLMAAHQQSVLTPLRSATCCENNMRKSLEQVSSWNLQQDNIKKTPPVPAHQQTVSQLKTTGVTLTSSFVIETSVHDLTVTNLFKNVIF